jgi:exopolyphosphatase/guanosine-5'-triphosphate,3'-diphosphate pyrophosphatase
LSQLHRDDIANLTRRLVTSTIVEIEAMGPVQPERAKVLAAGALLINEIAQCIGPANLTVSETDILDAIALGLVLS